MNQSNSWWRTDVIYQVYPRSFQDSGRSGMGDLAGITSRLGYLKDLGVDALWLSPFYPSPQVDAGYDVADYCAVDPLFGDLDDFDRMISTAHEMGLRVIVDLVPNHCSDQHPLFLAALASAPGSPERAMFHFSEGRGKDGELPPSNWRSVFGGSSWTRVSDSSGQPEQWYYHLFAPEQPDFNWDNPAVLEFFEDVLRFWLDRGVDGFRIDVSDALIKDSSWPDREGGHALIPKDESSRVHDIYRHFRSVLEEYPGTMAVLETGETAEIVRLFLRPDEMHQAFNFRFLKLPWNAAEVLLGIKESMEAMEVVGAPVTWVVENHDTTRAVTRYQSEGGLSGAYVPGRIDSEDPRGGADLALVGQQRARVMSLLSLVLPGSSYVYAGQELGLPEVYDIPEELRTDPIFFRSNGAELGRDGCRVPLPWSMQEPTFGFSENSETWLPQPSEWGSLSVEAQRANPQSMLSFFHELLSLRHRLSALGTGRLQWVSTTEDAETTQVLQFVLKGEPSAESPSSQADIDVLVIANFGQEPIRLPGHKVILSTWPLEGDSLPPNCAVLLEN